MDKTRAIMGCKTSTSLTRFYGILGKAPCGVAGGIVAFVLGEPVMIAPGVILGAVIGHFFEKMVLRDRLLSN